MIDTWLGQTAEHSLVHGLHRPSSRGQCKSLHLITTMQESIKFMSVVLFFSFLSYFALSTFVNNFCINSNVGDLPVYLLHNVLFKVRPALGLFKNKSDVEERYILSLLSMTCASCKLFKTHKDAFK